MLPSIDVLSSVGVDMYNRLTTPASRKQHVTLRTTSHNGTTLTAEHTTPNSVLTPEDATHEVFLPDAGDYFVDSYSAPDRAPVAVVRDVNGKLILTLEKADISRLMATGWRPPTPFTVKARDGETDLYGLMFKP